MKASSGKIYIDDEPCHGFLQDVGTIIERPNFIPYYNAFRNLKIIASYKDKVGDERIRQVIQAVGLDPDDKKKVKNYSLGMQQKLAVALALMEDPSILILDEPLNAMDEKSVNKVRKILLEEKKKGKLLIIASHYKEEVPSKSNNSEVTSESTGEIVGIEKKYYIVKFNNDSNKYISEPVLIKKSDFENGMCVTFYGKNIDFDEENIKSHIKLTVYDNEKIIFDSSPHNITTVIPYEMTSDESNFKLEANYLKDIKEDEEVSIDILWWVNKTP